MVKLYTSSRVKNCPFCEKARDFMSKHNIQYEEIDCATDKQSWNEMFFYLQAHPILEFHNYLRKIILVLVINSDIYIYISNNK